MVRNMSALDQKSYYLLFAVATSHGTAMGNDDNNCSRKNYEDIGSTTWHVKHKTKASCEHSYGQQ